MNWVTLEKEGREEVSEKDRDEGVELGDETYLVGSPDQESSYGSEHDSDDEESRENGSGGEDGLPCFESLLLEGSVWMTRRKGGGEEVARGEEARRDRQQQSPPSTGLPATGRFVLGEVGIS